MEFGTILLYTYCICSFFITLTIYAACVAAKRNDRLAERFHDEPASSFADYNEPQCTQSVEIFAAKI